MTFLTFEHGDGTRLEIVSENAEHARRVRACLHACQGIETKELERGIIAEMRRALDTVLPLLQMARDQEQAKLGPSAGPVGAIQTPPISPSQGASRGNS